MQGSYTVVIRETCNLQQRHGRPSVHATADLLTNVVRRTGLVTTTEPLFLPTLRGNPPYDTRSPEMLHLYE
jgi:hypothetical protein